MHDSSTARMAAFVNEFLGEFRGRRLDIVDFGSLDVNGSYRGLFADPSWNYRGLDMEPGPNVDIVAGTPYGWRSVGARSADVVISGQAFEHVEFPWVSLFEIRRVLRPGGLCCLIVPSSGPEHRYPLDCWRFYPDGLRALGRWADLHVVRAEADWQDKGWKSDQWHDAVLVARRPLRDSRVGSVKRELLVRALQFQAGRKSIAGRKAGSVKVQEHPVGATSPTLAVGPPKAPAEAPRPSVMPRRLEVFDQMLALFPSGRLVDLGAGPGHFALRAVHAGWDVTAVDARSERFPADPGGATWVECDIRKMDLDGFDVVACLGLFYHLTPEDQVALLERCKVPIILDTHVANGQNTHRLTPIEWVGDYEGAWYREPGATTSSWGNPRSFWPTPDSLYRMLADYGYPVVTAASPWILPDRTFFLALPAGYAPGLSREGGLSAVHARP